MITNPTRQRDLRGHHATRPTPRAANTAEHQVRLASRLTPRDRWIIQMLHEHRVLTSQQITAMAFPSFRSGRQRLRELFQWGVLDRFQPFVSVGTAPMHYVLGPAGATVLAAENGIEVKALGYRHDRAFGIAHSLRLAHTIGVNDWFTALIEHARHADPGRHTRLQAWWSEARCARHFGDLVKPDAYGRFTAHGQRIEFFLEYDFGTEPLSTLAGKLTGYTALAQASGIITPLLIWLPTSRREATARRALHLAWRDLDHSDTVPIATATAELLDPTTAHPSPADPVWLLLHATTTASGRLGLHRLPEAWPHLPPPITDTNTNRPQPPAGTSPPPAPMPPPPSRGPTSSRG